MNARMLLISCLLGCLTALVSCITEQKSWQGFQGSPDHGLRAYTAELRTSDLRSGAELDTGSLFVAHGKLRYEMKEAGPFDQMILLARLDSGQAWLINPAGNRYIEGKFAPQRWMDIGYLMGAFPKVARARVISSNEEPLGTEVISGHRVSKIRRTGREGLFGEERDFTDFFWVAEAYCIPVRHESDVTRTELTNIRRRSLADSHFALPAGCRKVSSFAELLK